MTKQLRKPIVQWKDIYFFYERDCITPTVDLPQMSTTDNTDSVRTMHEIMQEDIDGEISSTYNAIFSQPHMANIPPDPSEEAFLRDYHEEESVIHIGSETSFSAPAKPTSDPKSVRFQDSGSILGLARRSVLWLIKISSIF